MYTNYRFHKFSSLH